MRKLLTLITICVLLGCTRNQRLFQSALSDLRSSSSKQAKLDAISQLGRLSLCQSDAEIQMAVAVVATNITDGDEEVRAAACHYFYYTGEKGKTAIPQLSQALADPSAQVRASAALSLGIMAENASPALEELIRLSDTDEV